MVDNFDHLITESEQKLVRKKNECAAKRKTQLENLCTLVQVPATRSATFLSSCPGLFIHLLPHPALISRLEPSTLLLSYFGLLILLSSCLVHTLVA